MRVILVVLMLGIGMAVLLFQSMKERIANCEQYIQLFEQKPTWSPFRVPRMGPAPFPGISSAGPIESDVITLNNYSRYV